MHNELFPPRVRSLCSLTLGAKTSMKKAARSLRSFAGAALERLPQRYLLRLYVTAVTRDFLKKETVLLSTGSGVDNRSAVSASGYLARYAKIEQLWFGSRR